MANGAVYLILSFNDTHVSCPVLSLGHSEAFDKQFFVFKSNLDGETWNYVMMLSDKWEYRLQAPLWSFQKKIRFYKYVSRNTNF